MIETRGEALHHVDLLLENCLEEHPIVAYFFMSLDWLRSLKGIESIVCVLWFDNIFSRGSISLLKRIFEV